MCGTDGKILIIFWFSNCHFRYNLSLCCTYVVNKNEKHASKLSFYSHLVDTTPHQNHLKVATNMCFCTFINDIYKNITRTIIKWTVVNWQNCKVIIYGGKKCISKYGDNKGAISGQGKTEITITTGSTLHKF